MTVDKYKVQRNSILLLQLSRFASTCFSQFLRARTLCWEKVVQICGQRIRICDLFETLCMNHSLLSSGSCILSHLLLLKDQIISEWLQRLFNHSVLEQIQIKGSYPDQRLSQHESLYPIGLKSARIVFPHIGSHYIDFSKTDFY